MNQFIILSILFYSIYCSYFSWVAGTTDNSQCKNHDIEFNGYSCYKADYSAFGEATEGLNCIPFPNDSKVQDKYRSFILGYYKELSSAREEYKNGFTEIQIFKKGKYSIDETIPIVIEKLSKDDIKKVNGNNTCSYQLEGRYIDNIKKYPSGYPNIDDKNICFNVDQFPDLKGLVNCGYAKIRYRIEAKEYNYSTCYHISDNYCPQEIQDIWPMTFFSKEHDLEILEWDEENKKINGNKANEIFKKSNKRKLQENFESEYEIIVEDKFGKIVKFSSKSNKMEVIEKGDENANSYSERNSTYKLLNMIFGLLLLLILWIWKLLN